ncbi:MAG: sugar phosphate isomerase/epimerase [Actinobacteria bacterium]|nr:MAG: sugar phosphate isomerase/epimerase [Actinomycetota bacterium]REK38262.1 MAG: sugar phosphate isomerase/epimerase [Actinomycetota bacterium]
MKLGLLTAPFPETPLDEVAEWTAASGFTTIEIACWPASSGDTRRYAGTSHIDVDGITDDQAGEIAGSMEEKGLEISGLGYYPNPLHPDDEHRRMVIDHLKKVIVAAGKMKVPVVNTFIGADRSKTQDENWEEATKVWPEIISAAKDNGVKIAIENCPMIFSKDEWPSGHNLAYNPKIWRRMFEEFGETIGLNFDPSHLIWLMIDIESAILEFGERFYHFQAKDVMVDYEGLYENGSLSSGIGWQIPRLPGLGHVDWGVVFSALYRAGYDGPIIIEHEDRDFEATDELVKRGFLIARDVLQPYVH